MSPVRRLLVLLALVSTACTSLPVDPKGTLDRVRGEVLRAGAAENPPWVAAAEGRLTGVEVELVEDFAGSLDAHVVWTVDSEQDLFVELEEGRLDLVVGGLTSDNPFVDRAAFTRPYHSSSAGDHVMAIHMGENGFMVALEKYLLRRRDDVSALVEEHG